MIRVALFDTITCNKPAVLAILDKDGGCDIEINNRRDLAPWLPFLREVAVRHIGNSRVMIWWVPGLTPAEPAV